MNPGGQHCVRRVRQRLVTQYYPRPALPADWCVHKKVIKKGPLGLKLLPQNRHSLKRSIRGVAFRPKPSVLIILKKKSWVESSKGANVSANEHQSIISYQSAHIFEYRKNEDDIRLIS
jgi:hypothetical protein